MREDIHEFVLVDQEPKETSDTGQNFAQLVQEEDRYGNEGQ